MQRAPTLIDTGPIVAILNRNDPFHAACSAAFQELPAPLLTCWPVVTEAAYILGDWSAATGRLFALLRTQAISILPVGVSDMDAIEAILTKYSDQKFQLADATLMHLANRENIRQVLTLDRRDFEETSPYFVPHLDSPLICCRQPDVGIQSDHHIYRTQAAPVGFANLWFSASDNIQRRGALERGAARAAHAQLAVPGCGLACARHSIGLSVDTHRGGGRLSIRRSHSAHIRQR